MGPTGFIGWGGREWRETGMQSLPLLMKAEKASVWVSGILAARLEHVIWLSQQDVSYTSNQGPVHKDGGVVENLLWRERQQELQ